MVSPEKEVGMGNKRYVMIGERFENQRGTEWVSLTKGGIWNWH